MALGSAATTARAARAQERRGGGRGKPAPEYYELRTIRLRIGAQVKLVNDYLAEALLPALGRAGARPVGAFETMFGPEIPNLHVLIPYESLAAVGTVRAKLAADAAYQKSAAAIAYHGAPATQPAYVRMESALLAAFENLPRIEVPAGAAKKQPRIFELRTYESPSEATCARKMGMFLRLGETEIFRRVGLTPVFFGKTLVGARLPSFTYMLTFPDLAAREKAWAAFRSDPEWLKLRATPGYSDAEIMSNIADLLLRPTAYSEI